jgi:hypothetical protein
MNDRNSFNDAFNNSTFSFDNATLKFSAYANNTIATQKSSISPSPSPNPNLRNPQNEILEKKR